MTSFILGASWSAIPSRFSNSVETYAAATLGVTDRVRAQQGPLERLGGADIRPWCATCTPHPDSGLRDIGPHRGLEHALLYQAVERGADHDDDVGWLTASKTNRNGVLRLSPPRGPRP